MTDIVFTSLTGYPTKDEGGGNRIIHDLINNISMKRFSRAYCSYTFQKEYGNAAGNSDPLQELSSRKKIGLLAFNNLSVYKRLVSSPFYYQLYFKKVDRFFRNYASKNASDIIHAHHPLSLPYFEKNKAKKILTIHSKGGFTIESKEKGFNRHFSDEHFTVLESREREAVSIADFVTFPSKAAKELFLRSNDIEISEEKMKVIYNGIDVEFIDGVQPVKDIFRKYHITDDAEMYILNIAEHEVQKNIPLLINTVNVMVKEFKKNVTMINIGRGTDTAKLVTLVNDLGLNNHVKFLGAVPNTDVIQLMKVVDCFVLTSKHVVFDLVVLEALACGTAVFVSNDGGNKEIIADGENGYLHANDSADSIANAIVNRDLVRIKLNAKKSVLPFSLLNMVSGYESLYFDVLRERQSIQ